MIKGMMIPVQPNRRGGARLLAGSDYTDQIIRVGLNPNLSLNPFQAGGGREVGISEKLVFAVNCARTYARAKREVTNLFRRYRAAEIARLSPDRGVELSDSADVELLLTVRYLDLDADDPRSISIGIPTAVGTGSSVNYGG